MLGTIIVCVVLGLMGLIALGAVIEQAEAFWWPLLRRVGRAVWWGLRWAWWLLRVPFAWAWLFLRDM